MQDEKLIYLESDEEITSVIDKISKASSSEVALVIPRGGNLGQSIVNLKLLKKRSADLGKDVSLVTTDKISRNLASQVGISVYSKVEEVGKRQAESIPVVAPIILNQPETIKSDVPAPEAKKPVEEIPEIPGVRINRYYDQRPKPEVSSQSPVVGVQEPEVQEEQAIEEPEPTSEVIEQMPEAVDELPSDDEQIPIDDASPIEAMQSSDDRRPATDESEIPQSEFKNRKIEDISSPIPEEIVEKAEDIKPVHHKKQAVGRRFMPMRKRRALTILIASALVVVLAFGYLLLPQAKATITFKADSFTESADVQISTAAIKIDQEKLISPATLSSVNKDVSDTFQATGSKNIGNKATGKVTLFNAGSSNPIKIDAGQGLSYDSKKFVTKSAATIPGAGVSGGNIVPGQVAVDVDATDSGETYNLAPVKSPNKFVLDGFPSIQTWAESSAAFTGGSTQNVQIVQASDISAAQDKIKVRLSAEAKDEVMKKIPSVDKYIDGTLDEQISGLAASVADGTQAPTFTYKGTIKTTILSFNETNLRDAIVARYESKLPANRVMVQPDKITFDYQIAGKDLAGGTAQYKVAYSGKISSKIDQVSLKDQLRGKSIDSAKKILSSLDLAKDVSITMTPNLAIYKTLPLLTRSIKIETVYQAD